MKSETLRDQIEKFRECNKKKGEVNSMFSFNCQLKAAYTQMEVSVRNSRDRYSLLSFL